MNEHEEIEKPLKMRLSELRTHLAKVEHELHKPLPADSEDQAIELENQEALEVIEKTETTEIHQIEAALKRISAGTWHLRQVRRTYRSETPKGAAYSSYTSGAFSRRSDRIGGRYDRIDQPISLAPAGARLMAGGGHGQNHRSSTLSRLSLARARQKRSARCPIRGEREISITALRARGTTVTRSSIFGPLGAWGACLLQRSAGLRRAAAPQD
jgi:hypothetical protein